MRDTTSFRDTREKDVSYPPVGLVLLAAGASTRLGSPKQLLNYKERSLLRSAAVSAVGSVCRSVVVVLGACATRLIDEVSDLSVNIAINPQWEQGMCSSIRIGIETLAEQAAMSELARLRSSAGTSSGLEIKAAVIMLCDQPFVTTEVIDSLVAAYRGTGRPIIASAYDGTLGVPALFSRTLFAELTSLKKAEGAKKVIKDHSDDVFRVPFAQGAIDIDTPMDYTRLLMAEDSRRRSGPRHAG